MRHIGLEGFNLTMMGIGLKKERKKKVRLPEDHMSIYLLFELLI